MPRRTFEFDEPDRFVAGTIGQPGQRTFFLQARDRRRVVSVALEKAQVAVLADRLGLLVLELERRGLAGAPGAVPVPDTAALDEPLNEVFRAGTLTLGWDGDRDRVLVEAREQTADDGDPEETAIAEGVEAGEGAEEDDDEDDERDVFRVRISADAARSFVERAMRVIRSGRPPCPICGNPLDPAGHLCPRKNGHYVN